MDINRKILINSIFVIRDRKYIMAHLEEDIWENHSYGNVLLSVKNKKYLVRYAGVSNVNGTLAIKLIPNKESDLMEIYNSRTTKDIYIEV